MDFAFFKLPDGRAWIGEGPFRSSAEPENAGSFYINDFSLGDAQPWKTPATLRMVEDAGELEKIVPVAASLRIAWKKPGTEWFKMVFRRIRRDVTAHRLRKMVPVMSETGEIIEGEPASLLHRVFRSPDQFWSYVRVDGGAGFAGATPELLLTRKGNSLTTMALAGTARPSGGDDFASDLKEIEEHELVADFIDEALRSVGGVQREPRKVSAAAGLTHFMTRFTASLDNGVSDSSLVKLLHPTPAVGCLPRDEAALKKLVEYRRLLGTGDFFGAPFGIHIGGEFHCAVAIRGIFWKDREASLPCGCGIVAGSAFDHEWRELRQKREAVARLLGV